MANQECRWQPRLVFGGDPFCRCGSSTPSLPLFSEGCSWRSLRVTVANDCLQGLGVKGFPDEAVSDTISSHLHTATS